MELSGYCLLQPVVRGSMLRSSHSLLPDARTPVSDAAVQAGSSCSFPNISLRSLFGRFRFLRITFSLASVIRAHSKQCDAFRCVGLPAACLQYSLARSMMPCSFWDTHPLTHQRCRLGARLAFVCNSGAAIAKDK